MYYTKTNLFQNYNQAEYILIFNSDINAYDLIIKNSADCMVNKIIIYLVFIHKYNIN